MKYKFFYSLSFFCLYGSTAGYLWALWRCSILEASIFLFLALVFYNLSANWIYYGKDWVRGSMISFLLLFVSLFLDTRFVAFGVAISYFAATFIQVYLDEMCRSKEE